MSLQNVKQKLDAGGFKVKSEQPTADGHGVRLEIEASTKLVVIVYHSGKIVCQGKQCGELDGLRSLVGNSSVHVSSAGPASSPPSSRNVFVVYGHDKNAKTQLDALLRKWKLEPLILDQLPNEGKTIIEKLESAAESAEFAVVLVTPDDEGYPRGNPDEKAFRARQNVVMELGMLLAKIGRDRVAISLKDQAHMEKPSDIHGLLYIPFKDDIAKDASSLLAKEMYTKGFTHINPAMM